MHTYDAPGLPYFISSSGVMQFREVCYTVFSYAPYMLLQNHTITNLATFRVTIFDFFHLGPQPITHVKRPFKGNDNQFIAINYLIYNTVTANNKHSMQFKT